MDFDSAIKSIDLDTNSPSTFSKVDVCPPVAIFKLTADFKNDTNPLKVNMGVGAFRTAEGKPFPLPVVREAEKLLANDPTQTKEYLPIRGEPSFIDHITKFQLGKDHKVIQEQRTSSVQTISGTGALRMAAEFLVRYHHQRENTAVYVSEPTWGNHVGIFKTAGFKDIRTYKYWNKESLGLDYEGLLNDLRNAPLRSIFILHNCAHNPTGCDPTREQWVEIAKICAEREAFCIFDMAYQGFASGDPEADAWPARMFAHAGFEMACATSFAKSMGLYCERTGLLTMISKKQEYIKAIDSQLEIIARTMYSNPPAHGARIVSTIFGNEILLNKWHDQLRYMSNRITEMRSLLKINLEKAGCPGNWDHILTQIGMFSFTGLQPKQCEWLVKERSIYLLKNGRINMCAVTPSNVEYIAKSFYESYSVL